MSYRVLTATERERLQDPRTEFAFEVLDGLSRRPKRLESRYFYDDVGSALFERICDLEEYYVTRVEHTVLAQSAGRILEATGEGPLTLLDLGAGDGRKTSLLLDAITLSGRPCRYVPIDISEPAMRELCERMATRFVGLDVDGIVAEYFDGVRWMGEAADSSRRLVLFLGSNIGNMDRARALTFLRKLWTVLDPGDALLIGFDLKKDIDVLLRAYNDSQGVTAAFNLNVLQRINRELGGHFDVSTFRHFATYNVLNGAMELFLVSLEAQTVAVDALDSVFRFRAWEPIHTEYSYKYLRSDIEWLACEAGFRIIGSFEDPAGWFVDSLWEVVKG